MRAAESHSRATAPIVGSPRVAHVVPEYLPRSATFVYTLLRHQTRFGSVVVTQAVSYLDEFPHDSVVRLDSPSGAWKALDRALVGLRGYGLVHARQVSDILEQHECVLVHAHFGWSGRDSIAAAQARGVPLVTSFYGRDLSEPARARGNRLRPGPYRRLFRAGSRFVVEGPAMAENLRRIGAPSDRIRVVRIGIDLYQFAFEPRARAGPFVGIQVARFVEKKGLDLTIRAFAATRGELGPSELWLVGDGPLRAELERLVAQLGLSGTVRFHGMVSHDAYRELASRADVCVQPSRTASDGDTEGGAPTVLLEMQAIGVPVVATKHADIPSVVARPEELVPEDDVAALSAALVAVAREPAHVTTARLAEGRAFVERHHDAAVTARHIERVYDEALQ